MGINQPIRVTNENGVREMVTLKDVAKKAGVSIATVSCALNDSPKVTKKTKEKVLLAAKELHYTPNKTARNLKRRKTETIGLFLSDFGGPFYNELIQGVQEVTMANGYDLIVCSTYGGIKSTGYSFLKENGVDGAIVLAANLRDKEILKVARHDFPIVLLDRELEGEELFNIHIDNYKGAFAATQHLILQGYGNIGCIRGPKNSYDAQSRSQGFLEAMRQNRKQIREEWMMQGDFTEDSGYHAMMKMMEDRPDAVFCFNDEMAIGALRAIQEKGLLVPEDIGIVGFDDIQLASYIQPSLSTIKHPKYEWGVAAANCIFAALSHQEQKRNTILPVELVIRESTQKSK